MGKAVKVIVTVCATLTVAWAALMHTLNLEIEKEENLKGGSPPESDTGESTNTSEEAQQ